MAGRPIAGLTERHLRIYKFIVEYQVETGKSPSYRGIMRGACIKSLSLVSYYLDRLEAYGWLKRIGHRDIQITGGPFMQANVENGIREIRDQNVAILLLTFGFPVVNSRREGGTVYVGFDAEATEDTIQALRGNRPLPLADARMFIVGMATWKALIRDLT